MAKRSHLGLQIGYGLMAFILLFSATVSAKLGNPLSPTDHHPTTTRPPHLNVKSYLLQDIRSGVILSEENADVRIEPASLTKMMTMYIVSEALRSGKIQLSDKVEISKKSWRTGGSRMFLKAGEEVSVEDLIKGIIVESGNDAAIAMAEFVAANEEAFVGLMNQQTKELGMANTHFVNVTGLPDPNHYTTARDLSKLGQALISEFPEYYHWYKQKWFTYNGIKQPNRNRLLWHDAAVDGIKTGHTKDAGYCLVASAERSGSRLIAVIVGANSDRSRAENAEKLLNYGFKHFETHKLYNAGTPLTKLRVWRGASLKVPFGIANDFYVTIPSGQYNNLKITIDSKKLLQAPITKGQAYGNLKITLNDDVISTMPLIALEDCAQGSLIRRITDGISLSIHKLFSHS